MNRLRTSSGFTLVEVMIVLVILGVLGGIVAVSTKGGASKKVGAACDADLLAVRSASESYYAQNSNRWAPSITTLRSAGYLAALPADDGYVISYEPATGAVRATHGTPPVSGCPPK